jgi:hypothetical protein
MYKVKEWKNIRWYYSNTDLKIIIKVMVGRLLPKYV